MAEGKSILNAFIYDAIFDKDTQKLINDEKGKQRIFTKAQKERCWAKAM